MTSEQCPTVLDLEDPYFHGQTLPDALADYEHVHSTSGVCVKNTGPLCTPDRAEQGDGLEEVLAAHSVEDYSEGEFDGDASLLCCCQFVARGSDLYDAGHAHRQHVAEALAARIVQARAGEGALREVAATATPQQIGALRKIGRGQRRHPDTTTFFERLADALTTADPS